jgi:trimeric autotransporter adhesin
MRNLFIIISHLFVPFLLSVQLAISSAAYFSTGAQVTNPDRGIIATIAGNPLGDNGPASESTIINLNNITTDRAGNLYIVSDGRIRRMDAATGVITTIAGGKLGFSGDGDQAINAGLEPRSVAVDKTGNLFIADFGNNRIRYVDGRTGIISTIAGNGIKEYSGDGGPARNAGLDNPFNIEFDRKGNLFILERSNRIRFVDAATGIITTVAGNGEDGFEGDGGPAIDASFSNPLDIALDKAGNIFIADEGNNRIRRVDARTGFINTVAGNGDFGFSGDGGQAINANLYQPLRVALDKAGNLYIADNFNHRIRRVDAATGIINTVAGNGCNIFNPCDDNDGGPALRASLFFFAGLALDKADNIFIASYKTDDHSIIRGLDHIRRVDGRTGTINTVAGQISYTEKTNGDNGFATSAKLNSPFAAAMDREGNLFIADTFNHRIRRVDAKTGIITTVAGNGKEGFSGDGEIATGAGLSLPQDVVVDEAGNLFIADTRNNRIRKVEAATGIIRTVAGDGFKDIDGKGRFSGDNGPAVKASLDYPRSIAIDEAGNLYIADTLNRRIRKVDASTGIITTVAGGGDLTGESITATAADLGTLAAVAIDKTGNLFIVDSYYDVVEKVDAITGILTVVAGSGDYNFSGDGGPAAKAGIGPFDVAVDGKGNLFIADNLHNRIRKVDASTGIINTVAGSWMDFFIGDGGPAVIAGLFHPVGVAIDREGNLLIADSGNNAIRIVK